MNAAPTSSSPNAQGPAQDLVQGLASARSQNYVQVVGAAIVDDLANPTQIWTARRTEPPHLAGYWELPGGKVESGEDDETALLREIDEELGVEIRLGDEIPSPDAHPMGWEITERYRLRVWLAEVVAGVPAPIEDHDAVQLVPLEQWREVRWLPSDAAVLEAIEKRLTQRRTAGHSRNGQA